MVYTVAFDWETELIGRGNIVPRGVCASFSSINRLGERVDELYSQYDPALAARFEELLDDPDCHITGANTAFDMAVTARWRPRLLPKIFEAYEAGRIHDVMIRQKLLDLSDNGSLTFGSRGESRAYSLDALTVRHGGPSRSQFKKAGEGEEDPWRLQYGRLMNTPIAEYPEPAKEYAIDDSVWTLFVHEKQDKIAQPSLFHSMVSEEFQAYADFCLLIMTAHGLWTDMPRVMDTERRLEELMSPEVHSPLYQAGLLKPAQPPRPHARGHKHKDGPLKGQVKMTKPVKEKKNDKAIRAYVEALCHEHGIPIEMTDGGKKGEPQVSTAAKVTSKLVGLDPLFDLFLTRQDLLKLKTTYLPPIIEGNGIIYGQYSVLVETTRTSSPKSSLYPSMNIQNLPRREGALSIRELIVPRPGHWLMSTDVGSMELCTFAQRTYDALGHSRMREILNAGIDAHAYLGGMICSMMDDEFAQHCLQKGRTDIDSIYDEFMVLKAEDPKKFKHFRTFAKPTNLGYPGGLGPTKFREFARMTYGVVVDDRTAKRLREIWMTVFPEAEEYLRQWITRQKDPRNSTREEDRYAYLGITGMFRANCTYCSAANGFALQTPGAEGAKRAVTMVVRESTDVSQQSVLLQSKPLAFIHDEILSEVPADIILANDCANRTEELMIAGLKTVLPDVRVTAEPALMADRWYKGAEPVFNDDGLLIPWTPSKEAA